MGLSISLLSSMQQDELTISTGVVPYGVVELRQRHHRMDGKMTVSGICFRILYGGGREEGAATDETNWSELLTMEMDLMAVNIPFALLLCMF